MALLKRLLPRSRAKPFIKSQPLSSTVPASAPKPNFQRKCLTSPETSIPVFFRRFLHRRASNQLPRLPEFLSFPSMKDKVKNTDVNRESVLLDGGRFPVTGELSVEDLRKLLKLVHVEKVKMKLREINENTISYSEFVRICVGCCGSEKQGVEFAKMLDDAGSVIVLGNLVFLRPNQVAKSMQRMILESIAPPNDARRKELEQMEKEKAIIDQRAKAQARGELYCGLGLMMVQTVGFMRLTFWELSWDVMEPICFFVTSIHFFIGYAFFLRTSNEPSFESFFSRRFKTKQKRLMEKHKFDYPKYSALRRACHPDSCNQEDLALWKKKN